MPLKPANHRPSLLTALLILSGLLLLVLPLALRWTYNQILPEWRARPYRPLILQTANRYGLDPLLLESLIWRESRFNPHRHGAAGESGLMQIRIDAMRDYCHAQRIPPMPPPALVDPATNLTIGAWYLARAFQRWSDRDDPRPFALAEYNAGLINARKWANDPTRASAATFQSRIAFPTTRRYIEDILSRVPPPPGVK
jgi:soluble lytic murein transglycosylase